jgi:SAM-dependent methyltransferase
MSEPSPHYLGEGGKRYAVNRFDARNEFVRNYQARYFQPYCDPEGVLLDFGCGDGSILRALPCREAIGIEVNPACVEIIRRREHSDPRPIRVLPSLEEVGESSVDLVISNHALEHTRDPLSTLHAIMRVLKPGAKLVLVVPFDDWRDGVNSSWRPQDRNNHLFTWSPLNLGNLVTEAGFAVETIQLHTFACTPKLKFVYDVCGERVFRHASRALGWWKHRREGLCVARKRIP